MTELMEKNKKVKAVADLLDEIDAIIAIDTRMKHQRGYDMDTSRRKGIIEAMNLLGYTVDRAADGTNIIY